MAEQRLPQELHQRRGETLEMWRDRVYHQYRLPTMVAAASDVKFAYLDQVNPLLSRRILTQVRGLPDHLRTEKELFRRMVVSLSPDISFARRGGNPLLEDVLREPQMVELLRRELYSVRGLRVFEVEFVDYLMEHVSAEPSRPTRPGAPRQSWKATLSGMIPRRIKLAIRDRVLEPTLDFHVLAWRAFMVSKMVEILDTDRRLL